MASKFFRYKKSPKRVTQQTCNNCDCMSIIKNKQYPCLYVRLSVLEKNPIQKLKKCVKTKNVRLCTEARILLSKPMYQRLSYLFQIPILISYSALNYTNWIDFLPFGMISYHNGWKTFHMERFSTILVGFPSISSKMYPKEVVQMKVSNAFALLLSGIIENNKMYDICFIKKKNPKRQRQKVTLCKYYGWKSNHKKSKCQPHGLIFSGIMLDERLYIGHIYLMPKTPMLCSYL